MLRFVVKFIDLFSGIGGFHLALHHLGGKCVFASEIDSHARKTYELNHSNISPDLFKNNLFNKDITEIPKSSISTEIPDFDLLCGGFPCQPFSQAGYKKGFNDDRGNLFFHIANIIEEKKPKAFLLENVRHLLKHDDGKTFTVIKDILNNLGYSFYFKVIKASEFGLPQLRPRVFMVGFRNDTLNDFEFPLPIPLETNMSDVFGGECTREIGFTLRVGGRSSPIDDRRNWDGYWVNGEVRRLSPVEGKKMLGFPDDFEFPVTNTQAMKQLGNSVAVPVVGAIAENIQQYIDILENNEI
jgi:DNA (cytosine-5)-methyltransferase 1